MKTTKSTHSTELKGGMVLACEGAEGTKVVAYVLTSHQAHQGCKSFHENAPDLGEALANARLFKAAPKLLTALEDCEQLLDMVSAVECPSPDSPWLATMRDAIRAAIEKTRG